MEDIESREWETRWLLQSRSWEIANSPTCQSHLQLAFFDEGFPRCSPVDNRKFEIITADGLRHVANIDFANQYFSDWKLWIIISSDTRKKWDTESKYFVAAWREVPDA